MTAAATVGSFGLAPDDFWRAPYRTRAEVSARLDAAELVGVAIDAPARVPLDAGHPGLPVVGYVRGAEALPGFTEHALVVAVRLDTGEARADLLVEPDPSPGGGAPLDEGDEPPGGEAEGDDGWGAGGDAAWVSTTQFVVDLEERLRVPREPATWLVGVHLGAAASNRARVALERARLDWVDPAVEALRLERQTARRPAPIDPPASAPGVSYRRAPESPRLPPSGEALELRVPRRAAAGQPLVVRGALRARVPAGAVVRPDAEGAPLDVGDPDATAVVPVTLVLAGDPVVGPFVVPLRVPAVEPLAEPLADARGGGGVATAWFALDLLAHPAMKHRTAQRYVLWAFAGEHVSGPHELELRR